MHRRGRDPQRPSDLALAQSGLVAQPEHFSDLSHGGSGPRHPLPRSQDRTVMSERGCRSPPTPVPQRHTLQTGAPKPPEPVLHYPGTTASLPPERPLLLDRNGCSITFGGRSRTLKRCWVSSVSAVGGACRVSNCIDSCSIRSCICWPTVAFTPTREQ